MYEEWTQIAVAKKMSLQKLQEASQASALGCSDIPHHALTPCLQRDQLKSRALTWQCCIPQPEKTPRASNLNAQMGKYGDLFLHSLYTSTFNEVKESNVLFQICTQIRTTRRKETGIPAASPPWAPPDTRCCGAGAHSIPHALLWSSLRAT